MSGSRRSAKKKQAEPAQKLGSNGELIPRFGFSRLTKIHPPGPGSVWSSHDGLRVISTVEQTHLPGSGEPPLVGPQWLVSVSKNGGRCSPAEALRVVEAFGMPAWDEDNHHPGIARHLWCPQERRYQLACECKVNEVPVSEDGGDYVWTNDPDQCRGCEYEIMMGARFPCPIHHTTT